MTYLHFPLTIHPFAVQAAIAAHCAEERFGEFVDALFSKQDSIGLRSWDTFRLDAGIRDSTAFFKCMTGSSARHSVESGKAAGRDFAIDATPTLILNGWRFQGVLSPDYLEATIALLLEGKAPIGVVGLLGASTSLRIDTVNGARRVLFTEASFKSVPQFALGPVALGTVDGSSLSADYDLTNVTQVELLSDGRLVAFAFIGGRVMVFAADGRPEGRIGRAGRGPFELLRPGPLAKAFGDTLVTLDGGNRRFVLMLASEGVVDERSLTVDPPSPLISVAGGLPSKSLVVSWSSRLRDPVPNMPPHVRSVEVATMTLAGSHTTIARIPSQVYRSVLAKFGGQGEPVFDHVRFSPTAHVAVWDTVIVIASSDAYRIDLFAESGKLLGQLVANIARRPVSKEARRRTIEMELQALDGGGEELRNIEESRRLIRDALFADSFPAFESLHVGADQRLWVVDAISPTDSGWTATAFHLDGRISGRLRAQAAGRPMAFGKDRVVVRDTDEDGVVSLRVLRILPK